MGGCLMVWCEGPGISIHTVGATSAGAPSACGTSPIDGGGKDPHAVLKVPNPPSLEGRGTACGGWVPDGMVREAGNFDSYGGSDFSGSPLRLRHLPHRWGR